VTKTALIIGGGFAGCASAHMLSKQGGWDVTLIESNAYLGAGVRTHWYGGHPYTFGPRHFLTQNDAIFDYLNNVVPLRKLEHEFVTYVEPDNAFYNYPIHKDDIKRMPDRDKIRDEITNAKGVAGANNLEDYWIGSVGQTLFDKFIDGYNKKMWLVDDCEKIDTFNWSPKGVALKEGSKEAWDTAISAYPYAADGYNSYFDIATEGTKVLLNTRIEKYDIPNKAVVINGEKKQYDIIVSTIAPDEILDHRHGVLPFIGRDFHKLVFPTEHVFPEEIYFLYYANDEAHTRMVEYKKFTGHKSPTTLIGLEIPSMNGKHYPVPFKSEIRKALKYYKELPEGVFSMGRAGSYLYGLDIDDCIWQAMLMAEQVKGGGQDHPVPGAEYRFADDI
jgi:UDP-galactopyranose mutase